MQRHMSWSSCSQWSCRSAAHHLRGPSARVFSAMEILQLQFFLVVDAPVQCCRALTVAIAQVQFVHWACWYCSCVRGRFPSWRSGRFHGPDFRLTMGIPSCSTRWSMSLLCRWHVARSLVLVGPCAQVHGQGFPRHQGGEGVAGTPGACSQVFCHPISSIVRTRQDRLAVSLIIRTTHTTTTTRARRSKCRNSSVLTQFLVRVCSG